MCWCDGLCLELATNCDEVWQTSPLDVVLAYFGHKSYWLWRTLDLVRSDYSQLTWPSWTRIWWFDFFEISQHRFYAMLQADPVSVGCNDERNRTNLSFRISSNRMRHGLGLLLESCLLLVTTTSMSIALSNLYDFRLVDWSGDYGLTKIEVPLLAATITNQKWSRTMKRGLRHVSLLQE